MKTCVTWSPTVSALIFIHGEMETINVNWKCYSWRTRRKVDRRRDVLLSRSWGKYNFQDSYWFILFLFFKTLSLMFTLNYELELFSLFQDNSGNIVSVLFTKSLQKQSISKLLEKYRNRRTTMMTRITMAILIILAVQLSTGCWKWL